MAVKTGAQGEFSELFPVPKYTTVERDGLDLDTDKNAYIIYNTTTAQLEYTVDGVNWLAV